MTSSSIIAISDHASNMRESPVAKRSTTATSLSVSTVIFCVVVFLIECSILSRMERLATVISAGNMTDAPALVQRNLEATTFTFNGVPLEKMKGAMVSRAHCIGETHTDKAWMHKSCRIKNLCYNTADQSFVAFRSPTEQALARKLQNNPFIHDSSMLNQSVSIGGLNQKWFRSGIDRLKWSPKIVDNALGIPTQAYSMKVPLIFYHSLSAVNPGHLIWDDFLPMYTLMKLFQVELPILPLRYILQDGKPPLWASCEVDANRSQLCSKMTSKFQPLLVGADYPYQYTSIDDVQVEIPEKDNALICFETALVGMGDLTDHGTDKGHGWERNDYLTKHNHGRDFYDFRNFMLSNLHLPTHPPKTRKVVFSIASSDGKGRRMDFQQQSKALQKLNLEFDVDVHMVTMKDLTLMEQVELVHDAAVYISMCGGGAVNAMLLPKGASVILYYFKAGTYENGKRTEKPAPLDWDLMNSLSYLRVHWMPRETTPGDLDTFLALIQHELLTYT